MKEGAPMPPIPPQETQPEAEQPVREIPERTISEETERVIVQRILDARPDLQSAVEGGISPREQERIITEILSQAPSSEFVESHNQQETPSERELLTETRAVEWILEGMKSSNPDAIPEVYGNWFSRWTLRVAAEKDNARLALRFDIQTARLYAAIGDVDEAINILNTAWGRTRDKESIPDLMDRINYNISMLERKA